MSGRPAKGGPYAIAYDLAIAAKNAAAELRLGSNFQRKLVRVPGHLSPVIGDTHQFRRRNGGEGSHFAKLEHVCPLPAEPVQRAGSGLFTSS
jgi:hypothetical protein